MPVPDGADAKEWERLCNKARSTVMGNGTAGLDLATFRNNFKRDWSKTLGDYMKQFGLGSIDEMLRSMSDVLQMTSSGGSWHLRPLVADDDDREILEMNARHIEAGLNNSKKRNRRRGPMSVANRSNSNAYRFSAVGRRFVPAPRTMERPQSVPRPLYDVPQLVPPPGFDPPYQNQFYYAARPEPSVPLPPYVHHQVPFGMNFGAGRPGPCFVPYHGQIDAGRMVTDGIPQQIFGAQPRATLRQGQALLTAAASTVGDAVPQDPTQSPPSRSSTASFSSADEVVLRKPTLQSGPVQQPPAAVNQVPLNRPSSSASALSTVSTQESLEPYDENGRPKIYRFQEILEAHGGKMNMEDLRAEYFTKYGEQITGSRALREVLGVQEEWKTTAAVLTHVKPPVVKAVIDTAICIELLPNARELLDNHEWPNGYSPLQATAASKSGSEVAWTQPTPPSSEKAMHVPVPPPPPTSIELDLPASSDASACVEIVFNIGATMFDLCKHHERITGRSVRVDTFAPALNESFPAQLSKVCSPTELLQVLDFYFADDFAIHFEGKGVFMVEAVDEEFQARINIEETMEKIAEIISTGTTCMELPSDDVPGVGTHQVRIVHVASQDSPDTCRFLVRLTDNDDKFEDLCQQLKRYEEICRIDPEEPVQEVREWAYYLHSGRNGFARCQVLEVVEGGVQVYYVDDGRIDVVDAQELFDLPQSLAVFPESVLTCSMELTETSKLPQLYAKLDELAQPSENLQLYASFLQEEADIDGFTGYRVRIVAQRVNEPHKDMLVLPDCLY